MANTFTNVNDTKIMSDGIEALKLGLTPLSIFSIDVGSNPTSVEQNAVVRVPLASAREGIAYNATYEDGNTTIVTQAVNVNTHLHCSWNVTEEQAAGSPVNLFEMAAKEAGYGLALTIQNTVLNIITDANYGNTANTDERVVTASNFDIDEISDIRQICTKTLKWREQAPGQLGNAIMDGAYIANLLKDPALRDRSASGKDALITGAVGRINQFDFYENNQVAVSTPGSGGENMVGFFCQKAAVALAVRPMSVLGSGYGFESIVTDPETGASMSYRRWLDTATGTHWGTFTVMMGAGVGDEARMLRIISS